MELGRCLVRIIHRDITLTNIVIRPSCLQACDNYEPDEADDVDSIEAEENSVNGRIFDLNSERFGSREWFEVLGGMIAKLTNLKKLTLDGIDPENRYLERFWGEVCESKSLRLREGRGMGGQPFNFPQTCSWRWRVTACLDSWVEALDIFVSVEPVKVSRFQLCFNLDRKVKVTQLWPKSQSWKKFICRPLIPTVARSKLLNFDPKVKVI